MNPQISLNPLNLSKPYKLTKHLFINFINFINFLNLLNFLNQINLKICSKLIFI